MGFARKMRRNLKKNPWLKDLLEMKEREKHFREYAKSRVLPSKIPENSQEKAPEIVPEVSNSDLKDEKKAE